MERYVMPDKVDELVKSKDLQYLILLGRRSNGKSSAVKALALRDFIRTGEKFAYIRRYSSIDMKRYRVNSYFQSVPGFNVQEITEDKAELIDARDGELWLANYDNKGKIARGEACGYYMALSEVEHLKSLNFPGVTKIIFEEFCTDQVYLDDEVKLLFSVVSSITRNSACTVFLVANTISRVCPYFREFGLDDIYKAKPGDIQVYQYDTTNIGVWLTSEGSTDEAGDNESSRMFFGSRARMIKKGEWDHTDHRKLEEYYQNYEIMYNVVFRYDRHMFLMQLLRNSRGGYIWFVAPKYDAILPKTRIISNEGVEDPRCTIGFIPLSDAEKIMFDLLRQGKVAFTDGLTGTEFRQAYAQMMSEVKR